MGLHCKAALMTLAAKDFSGLVGFYRQLFEQEPVATISQVYAEFQLPGLRLGIFKPKQSNEGTGTDDEDERAHERKIGLLPVSLCVEVESLEAAIAHLTHLGYAPPGEIMIASHGREIYAADPEGNLLILHSSSRA